MEDTSRLLQPQQPDTAVRGTGLESSCSRPARIIVRFIAFQPRAANLSQSQSSIRRGKAGTTRPGFFRTGTTFCFTPQASFLVYTSANSIAPTHTAFSTWTTIQERFTPQPVKFCSSGKGNCWR